jgi:4-hydroxy-4-methyl-2-oxoglutarate aldolase
MYELGVVYRNIQRADRAAADKLAQLGSATVHEAMGRVGLMKPYMRPIYPGAQVSGTAVTVLLQPGDNWMMHVVAEQIQPGDIVVAPARPTTPTASSATCWPPRSRRAAPAAWSSTPACAT